MADSKHKIEVEIVANSSKFKTEMQKVSATTQAANKISKLQRNSTWLSKNKQQLDKTLLKNTTQYYKATVKGEQNLQKELVRTNKVRKDQLATIAKTKQALTGYSRHLEKLIRDETGSMGGGGAPPGGGGRGRGRRGGRGFGGFLGTLGKGALGLVGGAGLALASGFAGLSFSQLQDGYGTWMQYGKAANQSIGFGNVRAEIERARKLSKARGLGFTGAETASQAHAVARATGVLSATPMAQFWSRGLGMDPTELAGPMGAFTRAGQGFGGKAGMGGRKELIRAIEAGVASGLDRGRLPEYLQTVTQLTEQAAGPLAGRVSVSDIQALMVAMGKTGLPGLQGARGGALAAQIDAGIKAPGAGEAGQAFILRAMGFGKPGSGVSLEEATFRQEQGISNIQNVFDVVAQAQRESGGGFAQTRAIANALNISATNAAALREAIEKAGSPDAARSAVEQLVKEMSPEDMSKQIRDNIRSGFSDILKQSVKVDDHLLLIGEESHTDLMRIQNVLNEFVQAGLPLMVKSLTLIADTLESIYNFLKAAFGGLSNSAAEQADRLRINNEYDALKKAYQAGELSPGSYNEKVRELKKRAKQIHFNLEGEGAGTAAIEWGEDLWKKAARTLGANPMLPAALGPIFSQSATVGDVPEFLRRQGQNPSALERREYEQKEVKKLLTALMQDSTQGATDRTSESKPSNVVNLETVEITLKDLVKQTTETAAAVERTNRALQEGGVTDRRPRGARVDSRGGR